MTGATSTTRLLHLKANGDLACADFDPTTGTLLLPLYVILLYTWGFDTAEVTYQEICAITKSPEVKRKYGYAKIMFCADQAKKDSLECFWVDTCCPDKSKPEERSEAASSMFDWYAGAAKCYVYLSDVDSPKGSPVDKDGLWKAAFRKSRWQTRGWTLPELLAPRPKLLEFYSRQGNYLGNKADL